MSFLSTSWSLTQLSCAESGALGPRHAAGETSGSLGGLRSSTPLRDDLAAAMPAAVIDLGRHAQLGVWTR